MMREELICERLSVLESHINRNWLLLKEYEDIRDSEDDPRRLARYEREIKRQHELIQRYEQEFNELQRNVVGEPPDEMIRVGTLLKQMNSKLDNLEKGQGDIVARFEYLRQEVLSRFDTSEQKMVDVFIKNLNQNQLAIVEAVINSVEDESLSESELKETINTIKNSLEEIENQKSNLIPLSPGDAERLAKILDDPKLESNHKLKLAIPIIPLILTYEGEINLKCVSNLRSVWDRLKSKTRGN